MPYELYNCSAAATRNRTIDISDSLDANGDNQYLDANGNIKEELRFPEGNSSSGNSSSQQQKEQPMTIDDF